MLPVDELAPHAQRVGLQQGARHRLCSHPPFAHAEQRSVDACRLRRVENVLDAGQPPSTIGST
jgi:hypothetical protein